VPCVLRVMYDHLTEGLRQCVWLFRAAQHRDRGPPPRRRLVRDVGRGSCLDGDDIGLPLRTGIAGTLACVCKKYGPGQGPDIDAVNCDGTAFVG
jgi:hypothetical protein